MTYSPHNTAFQLHRAKLNALAYRMLGSISDTNDVLQEAYIRWQKIRLSTVKSTEAYLVSTTSRLCIDKLRKRKIEKLNYVGPWLPEPDFEEVDQDPEAITLLSESVSTAFLLMLEKLTPSERAVFILKEAFDFDHREVGRALSISAANSRQLLRRAKNRLSEPTSLSRTNDADTERLFQIFMQATMSGDLETLQSCLADDVIAYTDGGGRVSAAIIPLVGRERVITVFTHIVKKRITSDSQVTMELQRRNNALSLAIYEGCKMDATVSIDVYQNKIQKIYVVRNPEKLRHLYRTDLASG